MLTLYHLLSNLPIFLFDMFWENDNYVAIIVLIVIKKVFTRIYIRVVEKLASNVKYFAPSYYFHILWSEPI